MITDRDNGAKALLKKLGKPVSVKVGVMGAEASAAHITGQTIAEIATIQEFGVVDPPRSFIRAYVDGNRSEIEARIRIAATRVVKGKSTIERELNLLGLWIQGQIQQRIADGIPPDLADSTKKQRKGDGPYTPLIDTGQLRSSITYEVERLRATSG